MEVDLKTLTYPLSFWGLFI